MAKTSSHSRLNCRTAQSGQSTSEYVLLVALIIVPLARVFREFGEVLKELLVLLNSLVFGPGV